MQRLKIVVRGAVQGVGFRPFVYRLACELKLKGWVINSSQGVFIEVEGAPDELSDFSRRLRNDKPPRAIIQSCETSQLGARGYQTFEIRESSDQGGKGAFILPDLATCDDCLREIFSPDDRRFRYPFTNCTNCGPRFSIIEALPYDRARTSMKKFTMCEECAREYRDPDDRRFHAEPTACPRCGPQLELWDSSGKIIAKGDEALLYAAEEIRAGRIVALKGLGGFQLLVDARNEEAVRRLRRRKHREEKPFALMFPSLEMVRAVCKACAHELQVLTSPASPIVLLGRLANRPNELAVSIAPGNPNLGVMLPYTPLHHLLIRELNFPIVATSGNLSDEPICTDQDEALERLRGIADSFLVHDRPIVRHVDDSIVRLMARREMVLRRARGYAPLPITLASGMANHKSRIVLAVGAHLKNTVALKIGADIFVSQHIGDLATKAAHDAFRRSAADLPRLYDAPPELIAHDLHPEYLSTRFALEKGAAVSEPPNPRAAARKPPLLGVQHHWAHIVACMAENEIAPPALGVSWDGTGLGLDGTIWGGEFFVANGVGQVSNLPSPEEGKLQTCPTAFTRVAHLRQFRLPGGEQAIREPRRSALGLLHEIFGEELWEQAGWLVAFQPNELSVLRQMLAKKINAPVTSSAGRLFDAVAALVGLRQRASFEGQAAMELEFAADEESSCPGYPFALAGNDPIVIDWEPAIRALLGDIRGGTSPGTISAKFHHMLSETIVATAQKVAQRKVILSGGCFQNRYLTETVVEDLRAAGFSPIWHQRIPPNDGGIALGQAIAASKSQ
jgi:hydrogenase maturation protein HypF